MLSYASIYCGSGSSSRAEYRAIDRVLLHIFLGFFATKPSPVGCGTIFDLILPGIAQFVGSQSPLSHWLDSGSSRLTTCCSLPYNRALIERGGGGVTDMPFPSSRHHPLQQAFVAFFYLAP